MFEEVEKVTDALNLKQNLHYIESVPHIEQHCVL